MKEVTALVGSNDRQIKKILIPVVLIAPALFLAFFVFRTQARPTAKVVVPYTTMISQSGLEEEYGLKVNLVALTAAGGMVDVRLKIVDGDKAKQLLQDPNNFPSLWINDRQISLIVPEENKPEQISFDDNNMLFVMFPNSGSVVELGTPISLVFGNMALESIPTQ